MKQHEANEAKLDWRTRRFNRFNELVRELEGVDDFENAPRREFIETPGGQIPRKISGEHMRRLIGQLDAEIPEGGR